MARIVSNQWDNPVFKLTEKFYETVLDDREVIGLWHQKDIDLNPIDRISWGILSVTDLIKPMYFMGNCPRRPYWFSC